MKYYRFTITFTDTNGQWEDEKETIEVMHQSREWAEWSAWDEAEEMLKNFGEGWEVANVERALDWF